MATLAFFVFSFLVHPLAGRNINSISKVMQQMHERFRLWTGIFEDSYIEYNDTHYRCLPNTLFSFLSLTSRVQVYFRMAICPAKEKKKKETYILWASLLLERATQTVLARDVNKMVIRWSPSQADSRGMFYASSLSYLECRCDTRIRAAILRPWGDRHIPRKADNKERKVWIPREHQPWSYHISYALPTSLFPSVRKIAPH